MRHLITRNFNGLVAAIHPVNVMGILNLTPDSFSDGGKYNSPEAALQRVQQMVKQGASIIDLGAESTRPGSETISVEEELDRLLPVLKELPKDQFLISVDSCKIEVQVAAMEAGAHIINDIMGGSTELYQAAQEHQCGLVLMHTSAPPAEMQKHTDYGEKGVVKTVYDFFSKQHKILEYFDIPRYWVDPGIGFGKTPNQSIELLRNTSKFCGHNHGVLIGASRKSWIGKTFDVPVEERVGASLTAALHAAQEGAEILRVHDVQETTQALATQHLLRASKGTKSRLILEDIETRTRIGIHAEEKVAEQGIRISLQMEGDFAEVIGSDDLAGGVDYVHIIEAVREYCGEHRGNTLEHLAHHLAEHLKQKFRADAIDLTLDKPRYTGKLELSAIRFHVRR